MASEKFHRVVKYVLLICIPIMVTISILVGTPVGVNVFGIWIPSPDYPLYYVNDWTALLGGQNPYNYLCDAGFCHCYYPLGFLSFAGLFSIHFLAPKVVLCLVWIFTAYKLNELCKKYDLSQRSTIYFSLVIVMFNPFYIISLLVGGTFDVLIGLCILLAVIAIDENKQIRSGIYLALAFLFKYIGMVILLPLVFLKKKLNWKTGLIFGFIGGGVYLLGFLLWGPDILYAFTSQLSRSDIFPYVAGILGISVNTLYLLLLVGGGIVLAIIAYFLSSKNTDASSYSLIFLFVFLMILTLTVRWVPPGAAAWLLPLLIYWSITHEGKFQMTLGLYQLSGIPIMIFWGLFWGNDLFEWIGQIIFVCVSGIFALLIYLNRTNGEK